FIASYIFLDIGNLVNSIIEFATTIETKAVILSTVAESQTAMDVLRTAPTQYGNGYAISVFKLPSFLSIFSTYHFALLGLILASVSIFMTFYKKINRTNLAYIFIIVLFFVALRSTMTFIRMGIMLALAISIAGSFGFIKFIDYLGRYSAKVLKGNTKYWYGIVIIISVLVFSTNLASGYVFANGIYPSLDNAWYDAFIWIRDNTNKSDVVLEWWDFGYWFHYIAKRRTLVDGGYHGRLPTQDIAKFYTEPITEWSLKFLKNYSVDYVMVSPDLIGKFGAMSKIANWGKKVDVLPVFRLSNRYQRGDKMLFEYSMGDQKIIFAFSMKTEGNVTGMGNMTAIYRFGFSQAPIRYIGIGRDVIDTGASNAIDAMVYIMQNAAIFIPPAVKDCAFVRLYLLDGAGLEQYFEKVYDKLGMKIYKVRYDNFPDSVKNWKIENPNIDEEHDEFIPYGIGEE
ncbi:MAG TPA: hypothetical protein ENG42_01630, partial [Candidatus Aenigmarchaeota archaeon]|nr:hypothetical protein [Candidatus Aenigmarchaeota archaeon]